LLLIGSPVGFAGCSTTHQTFRKTDPETVLVTYHVKPGKEAEFQAALAQVWEVVPWKSETPLKSTTKNFNHPNGEMPHLSARCLRTPFLLLFRHDACYY